MACPGGPDEEEPDLRAWAEESIRFYAWAGEYDPEEVCLIIGEEIFGEDEEQEEWTEATVRRRSPRSARPSERGPK